MATVRLTTYAGAGFDFLFGNRNGTTQTPDETEAPTPNDTLSVDDLIRLANEAFENATAAQQSGDWSSYGQYLNQLRNYLNQLMPQEPEDLNQQISTDGTK